MEYDLKQVHFNEYCHSCKYTNKNEDEDPCDECLAHPVNLYSHKPVNWEVKKKGYGTTKNRKYGALCVMLGLLSIPVTDYDITFFILMLITGVLLFVTKKHIFD